MSSQQVIANNTYRDPDNFSYQDPAGMESRPQYAFNETRNSFLGLNVIVGDFSFLSLASWMLKIRPNSGEGLWIAPFRGLPCTNASMLLDLVYLDTNGRVLDLVESFPRFNLPSSSQSAASVLVLPSEAISSSDTRRGDLLFICTAEELKGLQTVAGDAKSRTRAIGGPVQILGRASGRTLLFPDVEHSQRDNPTKEAALSITPKSIDNIQVKESVRVSPPQRGRLARWLFPTPSSDRRKAPRKSVDNLTASFWTGGVPTVDTIRDISSSGLFVKTTERWYPGTVIRMTLAKPKAAEGAFETSICVCAEAIRWGNDGVGLKFAVNSQKKGRQQRQPFEGADRGQLDQFLKSILHDDQ